MMTVMILLSLLMGGCAKQEPVLTGHCYLIAGLYLITGDEAEANRWALREWHKWPDLGSTRDVFETYNDDPNLELFYDGYPTEEDLRGYLAAGYRVSVVYQTGPDSYHAVPFPEYWAGDFIYCYVAGYFSEDE